MEDEFRRTPTWRAKCQISGSGRPLRFELTFVLLELPLGKAELVLGPFKVLLQCGDLRSQCGRCQQRSLHTHIDILILDSCDIV